MSDVLLGAEGLVRRYGGRTVVDVTSLEVRAGEVLAVTGPNGAGKSTLFRLLLLLEQADAGSIRVGGIEARAGDVRARRKLAGVFQRPMLFDGVVRDNVAFGLRARGVPARQARERAEAALGALGLDALADARVHSLSGGEAQRVALARALVLEPEVLLLDEPTSNQDVTFRRRLRRDIEDVARRHARGIVLVTHHPAEAFGLADRVIILDGGRVVQAGAPDDIVLRPAIPFAAELAGAELLLHGTVADTETELVSVRIGADTTLLATRAPGTALEPGAGVVVAYRPEDVVLSSEGAAAETSAVNRLTARVTALVPAGALVRARVECTGGFELIALLTRRSVDALRLAAGMPVTAHVKATALHAWRRDAPARGDA